MPTDVLHPVIDEQGQFRLADLVDGTVNCSTVIADQLPSGEYG